MRRSENARTLGGSYPLCRSTGMLQGERRSSRLGIVPRRRGVGVKFLSMRFRPSRLTAPKATPSDSPVLSDLEHPDRAPADRAFTPMPLRLRPLRSPCSRGGSHSRHSDHPSEYADPTRFCRQAWTLFDVFRFTRAQAKGSRESPRGASHGPRIRLRKDALHVAPTAPLFLTLKTRH